MNPTDLVRRYYDDLWNRFDLRVAATLLAPEFAFRGSLGATTRGVTEFGRYVELVRSAFPDFHNTIEELIADGVKVVARLTYTGTHRGPLFGIPATGRRISYAGTAIFTTRGEQLVEAWVLGDLYGLLRQLDAVPPLDPEPGEPPPAPALPLAELRRLGQRALALAVDHLTQIRERPVFKAMTPTQRSTLLELPFPADGQDPDAILDQARDLLLTQPMGNGHPRFFGWVNSPPAHLGVLADLLAATVNPSVAGGDHAAVYLERGVVRWLMELVGFPCAGSMGLLTSGGSMANLTCLAAARHWAAQRAGWNVRTEGLQGARPPLVLYVSGEAHSCVRKAAEVLGLGSNAVRTIPADAEFHFDVTALRRQLAADRAAGLQPFCVAASAGTVNSGAIDPLDELADLCEQEQLWLHADGAYGAAAACSPTVPELAALARVHSLALDPHKWLSVPVECGCALVRDGALLRATFSLVPPYLRTEEGKGFGGLPWFSEYGFQQTRGYRALKVWATLSHLGRNGVAALVERHCQLARHLAALVDADPGLERLAPVELSIVCFRLVPKALAGDDARLNALNKAVLEAVQSGGEAFLSSTELRGRLALRACVLHWGTTEADVAALLDVVKRTAAQSASIAIFVK